MHPCTRSPLILQAAVIEAYGRDLSWEQLQGAMPYTDAVVRETLRLYPAAHGSFRRLRKDAQV